MAYNGDKTWAAGTVVLASDLQTYVSNNIKWLATDKPMARVTNTVVQTVAGPAVVVTFDTNTFDNAAMHNTGSNKERFTAPTGVGGKYLFGGYLSWASSAAGTYRALFAQANATVNCGVQLSAPGTTHNSQITVSGFTSLNAGQYVNLACAQDTGGNLDTQTDHTAWCFWVGN